MRKNSNYPFGFVMCCKREYQGVPAVDSPRTGHQQWAVGNTQQQVIASPCVISCSGSRLDPVGLRYCGCQVPGGSSLSRPEFPPTRQSSTWLFSGSCRLHSGLEGGSGALGLPDGGGLSFSSTVKRQTLPLALG